MERDSENNIWKNLTNGIKKIGMDKLFIMALCGIALVVLSMPGDSNNKKEKKKESVFEEESEGGSLQDDYQQNLEQRLEQLLETIKGVGKAEVMIMLEDSGEELVLYEQPYSQSSRKQEGDGTMILDENYVYEETVVYKKDSQGNEIPYIVSKKQPEIRGVAIVCQGGNQAELVIRITSLIEALFHIEAHKISVIGMK